MFLRRNSSILHFLNPPRAGAARFHQYLRSPSLLPRATTSPLLSPFRPQTLPLNPSIRIRTVSFFRHPSRPKKSHILSATLLIAVSFVVLFYGIGYYYIYLLRSVSTFPPDVAQELRRALYYSNKNDIKKAAQHYLSSLEKAKETNMDPLSDEVTGIKIALAKLCEDNGREDKAIELLVGLKGEIEKGVKKLDDLRNKGEKKVQMNTGFVDKEGKVVVSVKEIDKLRRGLLKRLVGTGIKLAELYENQGKVEEKEKVLVQVVEMTLRETMEMEGVERIKGNPQDQGRALEDFKLSNEEVKKIGAEKHGEGEWLTDEEIASVLETLASHYADSHNFTFAMPLYSAVLRFLPKNSCHVVEIMNNISAGLMQYPLPPDSPTPREELLKKATAWAEEALKVSKTIKYPERTIECDKACVATLYNLARLYLMLGNKEEARGKTFEGLKLVKGIREEFGEDVMKLWEELRRECD